MEQEKMLSILCDYESKEPEVKLIVTKEPYLDSVAGGF